MRLAPILLTTHGPFLAYLETPVVDFLKFNPDLDLVIEVARVEVVFFGF